MIAKKRILPMIAAVLAAFAMMLMAGQISFARDGASPATGGVVRSADADSAIEALGSDNAGVSYDADNQALTIKLQNDITLQNPLQFAQSNEGDTVVLDLNGHTITGAAGTVGGNEEAAAGKSAIVFYPLAFDLEIKGPGCVTGGDGAVCVDADNYKSGADGGMGISIIGPVNESYEGMLTNGLRVTGGAVIKGGDGADISKAEWQYSFEQYAENPSANCPVPYAGNGGTGIAQPVPEIDVSSDDELFYPAYAKIEIIDGTVQGGNGGGVDLTGITPTTYALMSNPLTAQVMQDKQIYYFDSYLGGLVGMYIGSGGDGIRFSTGRKYVFVDTNASITGGDCGTAEYGSAKTYNRYGKGSASSGTGLNVYGDFGLTNDAVEQDDLAANWSSRIKDSADMGIYIAGSVTGGSSPDASALNENTQSAGDGIMLHGEIRYGNSSNWGILEVAEGGSVTGGNAGTAVSGSGGNGGNGIYEAYTKDDGTTGSPFGTDYYIINGNVTGGNGGTAYANASSHYDSSYSTMVYKPALSGSGEFGLGGNGFLFGSSREGVYIYGSGKVSSGDSGDTVNRSGADVSDSASKAIHVYPEEKISTFHVAAETQKGKGATALNKDKITVKAHMSDFTDQPTSDTKLSCEINTPADYTGPVYIQWVGTVFPLIYYSGSDYAGYPKDIESSGTDYTDFQLLSNGAYQYLAYTKEYEGTDYKETKYNYDIATADLFSDAANVSQKKHIYCYVLLDDGRWGKSNVMEFTSGWKDAESGAGSGPSEEDQAAADNVQEQINSLTTEGIENITLADAARIAEIRAAYEALTDAQKELVNIAPLEAAESKIGELNQEKADEVVDLIEQLPSAEAFEGLEDAAQIEAYNAQIEAAITAYNGLTDAQKRLVDNSGSTSYLNNVKEEFNKAFPETPVEENVIPPAPEEINIGKAEVTLSTSSYTYNRSARKPAVTVSVDGKELTEGTDYTVTYKDNINVGTATVIVTGKGAYSGSAEKTFRITAKKITPSVTLSTSVYTWTGKVRKPAVTVKDGAVKLTASNYTVTYASGRKNVGKYSVKVTLKGNYSGTKTVYLRINPKGTSLKKLTRAKKAATVRWTRQGYKMSSSRITGYQILLATNSKFTKNKKLVTVKGYSKVYRKVTKLKGGKKYYVKIRTYKTVSGTRYYSTWSKVKTVTTKK